MGFVASVGFRFRVDAGHKPGLHLEQDPPLVGLTSRHHALQPRQQDLLPCSSDRHLSEGVAGLSAIRWWVCVPPYQGSPADVR